jgi:phosphate transport system substrate-binding protein
MGFCSRSVSVGRSRPFIVPRWCPIVLATYALVCSKYPDAETGKAVRAFLQLTIGGGQAGLADHGYIRLPEDFQSKVETAVNAIS